MLHVSAIGTTQWGLPSWVPQSVCRYLAHTVAGLTIRALARAEGCHASTILRQVQRFENLRDDLLVDEALRGLGRIFFRDEANVENEGHSSMTLEMDNQTQPPNRETLDREARRVLRRLCETGAVLAVAVEMDKAVVVRDTPQGGNTKTAVVDREIAQAMALKDWITCKDDGKSAGRISRYHITAQGRSKLNRLLAAAENRANGLGGDAGKVGGSVGAGGFAEAQSAFGDQHREWDEKSVDIEGDGRRRRVRYNLGESPLTSLARRKDKDGEAFLSDALVGAGERLREDFELAQMGPRVTQNWDNFLTGGGTGSFSAGGGGSSAARKRIADALGELGPGLGDVALRCCCFLEGLEAAEKRMGWSARSGKIVLRIALQRLHRHYQSLGEAGGLIG